MEALEETEEPRGTLVGGGAGGGRAGEGERGGIGERGRMKLGIVKWEGCRGGEGGEVVRGGADAATTKGDTCAFGMLDTAGEPSDRAGCVFGVASPPKPQKYIVAAANFTSHWRLGNVESLPIQLPAFPIVSPATSSAVQFQSLCN